MFDVSSQMVLYEKEEDQTVFKKLKREIRALIEDKIKVFLSGKADSEILKMLYERKTFPTFSDDEYGELKKRDLIIVTKELYCLEPRIFFRLKEVQEKSLLAFLNLILCSEERENILQIIDNIVQLSPDQRSQLAGILQKTKLQNIIETITFIENRYRVIEILKTILYDLNKFANERDHIQQIVENNYWLFGEQYHLVSSDQTMIHALENYNYILYGLKNATDSLPPEENAIRRMDIFLCGARQAETAYGQYVEENIVVEIKAPNVILSISVYRQIEDYMRYILKKPQFNSIHRRWRFIAVCREIDEDVKALYDNFKNSGKPGLVFQINNFEIYALTWDDIFTGFDLRHGFLLNKLKINRDSISKELNAEKKEEGRDLVNRLTQNTINTEG